MTEIIAEISGNHGGILANAIRLIREAKACGADAVKFQCFDPDRLASKRSKNPHVVRLGMDFHGLPLRSLYRDTHTPREWFDVMIRVADEEKIPWFSSVFDPDDVTFLESLGCPRYKISAFEMLDGDLINAVVATRKPIILSVRPIPGFTILRASEYGGADSALGVSDHSPDMRFIVAGCPMVERHLKLPDVGSHDGAFSSTPDEFRKYVQTIRSL